MAEADELDASHTPYIEVEVAAIKAIADARAARVKLNEKRKASRMKAYHVIAQLDGTVELPNEALSAELDTRPAYELIQDFRDTLDKDDSRHLDLSWLAPNPSPIRRVL